MSETPNLAADNKLKADSLGVGAVTFLVISAAAPLTAAAGGIPIAMLMGNGPGIALGFVIVTVTLLLFAAGYVAMARHITNAGAFYAFTAQGLGGRAGGAAAMVAILAYNMMQIGVMGLLGAAAAGTFGAWGVDLPWWAWCYLAIALVGIFGYRQVDLSAKILLVLVVLEYLIVLVIDGAIIAKGGDAGLSLAPFSWSAFNTGSPAVGILFCFAAFIGFEATTIYSEEARNPRKTVPQATYISVLLIGVFYVLTSWLMTNGIGAEKLVPTLQTLEDPTVFLFNLADRYVGGPVTTIMSILFVTSLFAGVLAFHNGAARYKYVAGREGLLPDGVGVTHAGHKSPHVGSLIQTGLSFAVVTLFAVLGLDPVLNLFTWLTQVGTLGILGLMAACSAAVLVFFARNPGLESGVMSTKVLPAVSGLILLYLFIIIFRDFGDMTGASGWLGIFLPSLVVIAAVSGFIQASALRGRDRARYDRLGTNR